MGVPTPKQSAARARPNTPPSAETLVDETAPPFQPEAPEPEAPKAEPPASAPEGTKLFRGAPPPSRPAPATVRVSSGDRLPGTRYRLLEWLGDGGMGVVYKAEHIDLGRPVALKILRSTESRSALKLDMFRSEARTLGALGSEYIVEVYDFAELSDGRLMFTMELLSGRTVRDALNDGAMDPARTIGILRQVCKGLAAAHSRDIVHRDIKPDNIALSRRNKREDAVKLLDFGIATAATADPLGPKMAGTAAYLAPEAIEGKPIDARTDLYALGCTAYEMLTGLRPFDGEINHVLMQQVESPPPDASQTVPGPLWRVLQRCLAKSPDDRYADAADLEAALCEAQIELGLHTPWDDLPLPDVEPERGERLATAMPSLVPPARSRLLAWLPLLAAAALLTGFAVGWGALQQEPPAAAVDDLEERTDRARAAAARAYFVYPAPDAQEEPTAYSEVRELERLGDELPGAAHRAATLRDEFAATLVRLGDKYWEREGGKPFAIDYYAEALVFDPTLTKVAARAGLSPGLVTSLRLKAENKTFSRAELLAVEPLVALAEDDDGERERKLEEIRARETALPASTAASLETLVGKNRRIKRPTRVRGKPQADGGESPPPTATDPVALPEPEPAPDPSETVAKPSRDPKRARRLAAQGNVALRRGDLGRARALFEEALAADLRSAGGLAGLARVHFEQGRYAKAVTYGRRAVRHAPKNADYRIRLGDAYYKSYQFEPAKQQFERAKALGDRRAGARLKKTLAKLQ